MVERSIKACTNTLLETGESHLYDGVHTELVGVMAYFFVVRVPEETMIEKQHKWEEVGTDLFKAHKYCVTLFLPAHTALIARKIAPPPPEYNNSRSRQTTCHGGNHYVLTRH